MAVARYSDGGKLSDTDEKHRQTCRYCDILLLSVLRPDAELLTDFVAVAANRDAPRGFWARGLSSLESESIPAVALTALVALFFVAVVVVFGNFVSRAIYAYKDGSAKNFQRTMPLSIETMAPVAEDSQPGLLQNVNLILNREDQESKRLIVPIGWENHRIDEGSFPRVAAGVVTIASATDNSGASNIHEKKLLEEYSKGIAELSSRETGNNSKPRDGGEGEALPSIRLQTVTKPQVSCGALAQLLVDKDLVVTRSKIPSFCWVKCGSSRLKINPSDSLSKTIALTDFLRVHKGNIEALNDKADGVRVSLDPATLVEASAKAQFATGK